ncbi:Rop guanine nucleotide exchange factor 6 [Bienertia sinuspersici]
MLTVRFNFYLISQLHIYTAVACLTYCNTILCFCCQQNILDSFSKTEFWYVDQEIVASDLPGAPAEGLQESSRKQLDHKREFTHQIPSSHVSSMIFAEMDVPESYMENLHKDTGKLLLESYSEVLESLAFNIVVRIDDLLYVDDITKHTDKPSTTPNVSVFAHKKVQILHSVPPSCIPYGSTISTRSFYPVLVVLVLTTTLVVSLQSED